MAVLVRKLASGDVAVFDKSKRELFLVPADAARSYKDLDLKTARILAKDGKAKRLSKDDLTSISQAFAEIVLLAVAGSN